MKYLRLSLCHEDVDLRWVYQMPHLEEFSAINCPARTSRNFPLAVSGAVNWHQLQNLPLSFPKLSVLNLEAYSPLVFDAHDKYDGDPVVGHGYTDTRDVLDPFSPLCVLKQLKLLHLDTYQVSILNVEKWLFLWLHCVCRWCNHC